MPLAPLQKSSSEPEIPSCRPVRPKFHHRCTDDRIREGFGRPPSFSMSSKITRDRKSVFRELGLDTDEPSASYSSEHEFSELNGLSSPTDIQTPERSETGTSNRRETEVSETRTEQQREVDESEQTTPKSTKWYLKLTTPGRRPRIKTVSSAPPPSLFTFTGLSAIVLLIAVVLPGFSYYKSREEAVLGAADAGVIPNTSGPSGPVLELRAESPTRACKRWAHHSELSIPGFWETKGN